MLLIAEMQARVRQYIYDLIQIKTVIVNMTARVYVIKQAYFQLAIIIQCNHTMRFDVKKKIIFVFVVIQASMCTNEKVG